MRKSRYLKVFILQKVKLLTTPNGLESMSIILGAILTLFIFGPYGTIPKEERIVMAAPLTLPCLLLYFYSQKKRGYRLND